MNAVDKAISIFEYLGIELENYDAYAGNSGFLSEVAHAETLREEYGWEYCLVGDQFRFPDMSVVKGMKYIALLAKK